MDANSGPQSRRPGLSLVVPAYNEAAVIEQAVAEANAALARVVSRFEVLVVDDGSTDETASAVRSLLPRFPRTKLLTHPANRGYGAALRTGFEAARFDLIAFTDADCQFDLTDLGRMLPLTANVPIVVGYRRDRQDPWRRRFYSWGYNVLTRTLLGTRVRDCDCALKLFRRAVLDDLLPESRGFFVNTEMLTRARQRGYPLAELPVTHRPRLKGESKVSVREVPRVLRVLLGFWWSHVLFAKPLAHERQGVGLGAQGAFELGLAGGVEQHLERRPRLQAELLPQVVARNERRRVEHLRRRVP
jgi:dolichol-phosphate mannosyltransferase